MGTRSGGSRGGGAARPRESRSGVCRARARASGPREGGCREALARGAGRAARSAGVRGVRARAGRGGRAAVPECVRALPWLRRGCPRCALPRAPRSPLPSGARRVPARVGADGLQGVARRLVAALKFRGALVVADVMAAQIAANLPPLGLLRGRRRTRRSAPVAGGSGRGGRARRGFDPARGVRVRSRARLPRSRGGSTGRWRTASCARDRAGRQVGASRRERSAPGRLRHPGARLAAGGWRSSSTTSTRPARHSTPRPAHWPRRARASSRRSPTPARCEIARREWSQKHAGGPFATTGAVRAAVRRGARGHAWGARRGRRGAARRRRARRGGVARSAQRRWRGAARRQERGAARAAARRGGGTAGRGTRRGRGARRGRGGAGAARRGAARRGGARRGEARSARRVRRRRGRLRPPRPGRSGTRRRATGRSRSSGGSGTRRARRRRPWPGARPWGPRGAAARPGSPR